jgi:hypothetical protein
MEAAAALGDMAEIADFPQSDVNVEMPAIAARALVQFYREACFKADTGCHLPLDFQDLGEFEVRLAVIVAMARARTPLGTSPEPVLDLILGALKVVDNRNLEFDSTGVLHDSPLHSHKKYTLEMHSHPDLLIWRKIFSNVLKKVMQVVKKQLQRPSGNAGVSSLFGIYQGQHVGLRGRWISHSFVLFWIPRNYTRRLIFRQLGCKQLANQCCVHG